MRKAPRRYRDTVFDERQFRQLQDMLGRDSEEHAFRWAFSISTAFHAYLFKFEEQKKTSGTKKTKRELAKVAKDAKAVAVFLNRNPIAPKLVHRNPKSLQNFLELVSTFGIGRFSEGDPKKLKDIVDGLEIVAEMAEHYASNDENLRKELYLPRLEDAGKLPYVARFWPRLFFIWEEVGNEIAGTPEGPLHRFVSLVHEACGLPKASASTLRDAAAEWNRRHAQMKVEWKRRFGYPEIPEDQL